MAGRSWSCSSISMTSCICNTFKERTKVLSDNKVASAKMAEDSSYLLLRLGSKRDTTGEDEVKEQACEHVFVATRYMQNAPSENFQGHIAALAGKSSRGYVSLRGGITG